MKKWTQPFLSLMMLILIWSGFWGCAKGCSKLELDKEQEQITATQPEPKVEISGKTKRVKAVAVEVLTPTGTTMAPVAPYPITDKKSGRFQITVPLFDSKTPPIDGNYTVTAFSTASKEVSDQETVTLEIPPPTLTITEVTREKIVGKTDPGVKIQSSLSFGEIPVELDGTFTIAPIPSGTENVTITATNWANKKTETDPPVKIPIESTIILRIDPVRVLDLSPEPPKPVTVSGQVTASLGVKALSLTSPYKSPIPVEPDGAFKTNVQLKRALDSIILEATDNEGNKKRETAPKRIIHPPIINAPKNVQIDFVPTAETPAAVPISGRVTADLGLESFTLTSPYPSPIPPKPDGSFEINVQLKSQSDQIRLEAYDKEGNQTAREIPVEIIQGPIIDAKPVALFVKSGVPLHPATVSGKVTARSAPATLKLVEPEDRFINLKSDGSFSIPLNSIPPARKLILEAVDGRNKKTTQEIEISVIDVGLEITQPPSAITYTRERQIRIDGRVSSSQMVDQLKVNGRSTSILSDGSFATQVPFYTDFPDVWRTFASSDGIRPRESLIGTAHFSAHHLPDSSSPHCRTDTRAQIPTSPRSLRKNSSIRCQLHRRTLEHRHDILL